jgi:uncharacterized protein YfaS (alpha-2-macroglobulin family)
MGYTLPIHDALTILLATHQADGTWDTTSATVAALKTFIESARASSSPVAATVQVQLDSAPARSLTLTTQGGDQVQYVTFDGVAPGPAHTLTVQAGGSGSLLYQVTSEYYRPWPAGTPPAPVAAGTSGITVTYDRTTLAMNDLLTATVQVALGAGADQALIDLGVPPGFSPETASLDALITPGGAVPAGTATIERYEWTGRQILVYVRNLAANQPLQFHYQLRARFPLQAQTPPSRVYDYYNPAVGGEAAPQGLIVTR